MNEDLATLLVYASPLAIILAVYLYGHRRKDKKSYLIKQQAIKDGLNEPASLHPIVNEARCIGCGSCISACPEKDVLGLIGNKANLISPSECIGHGACKAACPTDAIRLVFGTKNRGIDLPKLKPNFETNIPGIFIAGELGGMGLIKNAISQGTQAMESIHKIIKSQRPSGDVLDVLIVGAGPAGFAATLYAIDKKFRYVTLEQDSLGGTIAHFPRGKLVMTAPADLPLHGKMRFKETTKEVLMSFWKEVAQRFRVKINYKEAVTSIDRRSQYFTVNSTKRQYKAKTILLAIGRRGTPRKLDIPGEDRPKVVYRLKDPDEYKRKRVMIVGGGDSALEAAISIAALGNAKPTLVYRNAAFNRAKKKNRDKVREAAKAGKLRVLMSSQPKSIGDNYADLKMKDGSTKRIKNDAVIICAGGVLPTGFLQSIGIKITTKYGTE